MYASLSTQRWLWGEFGSWFSYVLRWSWTVFLAHLEAVSNLCSFAVVQSLPLLLWWVKVDRAGLAVTVNSSLSILGCIPSDSMPSIALSSSTEDAASLPQTSIRPEELEGRRVDLSSKNQGKKAFDYVGFSSLDERHLYVTELLDPLSHWTLCYTLFSLSFAAWVIWMYKISLHPFHLPHIFQIPAVLWFS